MDAQQKAAAEKVLRRIGSGDINRLVYYEDYDDVTDAIYCEKQLKGWLRSKKSS